MSQLLEKERKAIPIDGKGGDDGLDCFVLKKTKSIEVYQIKFFLNNLTTSQKKQIKQSYETACKHFKVANWILCIPKNYTPAEKKWFESINTFKNVLEWWGETKIRNLLAKYPEISHQYFREEIILQEFKLLKLEIREILNNTTESRKSGEKQIKAPNTLPRDTPLFTGRENQILKLKKVITRNFRLSTPTVVISSIDGMPGVGKTALAVKLSHLLTPFFKDGQLFIDCFGYTTGHNPLLPEQILDSLLFAIGTPASDIPKGITEKTSLWRSILSQKNVLIVLDNVNSKNQIEQAIPGSAGSVVIVTSRNRITNLSETQNLTLNVFTKTESLNLIKKIVGQQAIKEPKKVEQIAIQSGYLPLALNIMSDRWRKNKLFNNLLNNQSRNLKDISPAYEFRLMDEIFNPSYNSLNRNERTILQLMGLYPGLTFTASTCGAMMRSSHQIANKLIISLIDQSLVIQISNNRYKLHDLIRDFSRRKYLSNKTLSKQNKPIINLIDHYLGSLQNANNILYPHTFKIDFSSLLTSLEFENFETLDSALLWTKNEIENVLSVLDFALNMEWGKKYWQISQAISIYLKRNIPSWRAIQIQEQALKFAEDYGDLEMYASSLTELGLAHLEAGNFTESEICLIRSEIYWTILQNDEGRAYCLNGYGFTLERLGQYSKALIILNKAFITSKSEGVKAFTMNAMGAVNWRTKNYKKALAIFKKTIRTRKKIKDWVGLASTTNNLAFTYLKIGNAKDAIANFQESLFLFKKHQDQHGLAVVLNNLGYTSIEIRDYESAQKYSTEAKHVATIIGNSYQIGRSYDVSAKAFLLTGDSDKAKFKFNKSLKIFEKLKVPEAEEVSSLLQSF